MASSPATHPAHRSDATSSDKLGRNALKSEASGLTQTPIQFVSSSGDAIVSVNNDKRPAASETMMQQNSKRRRLTACLSRTMPLSEKSKDTRITIGLHNPGNFCYRRSVLQSILNVPVIVNWLVLRAQSHRQELGDTASGETPHNCLFCAVANLAKDIWVRRKITSLNSFDQRLRELDPHKMLDWPRSHRQADAHEFLHVLIDHIVDTKHGFNNPSPIAQGLFSLRISRQWTCKTCHLVHTASPVDETGLTLAIANPRNGNIDDYIRQYFSPEEVEARCESEQCPSNPPKAGKGQKSPALPLRKRTATITSTPEVLFVQFNRFAIRHSGGHHSLPRKERKRVPYSQYLDLSQHVTPATWQDEATPSSLQYRLTAVVAHQGEKNSGHYIAYVVSPRGAVHEVSDASVRSSTAGDMLNPPGGFTPYILTYVQVGSEGSKRSSLVTNNGIAFSAKVTTNGIAPSVGATTDGVHKHKHKPMAVLANSTGLAVRDQASPSLSPVAMGRLTLRGSSSEEEQEKRHGVMEDEQRVAKASLDFMRKGRRTKAMSKVQGPAWASQGKRVKFRHGKTKRRM